jgi:hypothetical protein
MKLYRVKDWATLYENNRTRELKHMAWVPVPNSHDGDGYTALVCRPDGPELFGAWIAILQVASRCGIPAGGCGIPAGTCGVRGYLVRGTGSPHDAASLSRMTRFPEKVIAKALSVLSSDEVGWLECLETPTKSQIPQEGAGLSQDGAVIPQEGASIPHPSAMNRTERTEGNGTEWKGTERADAPRVRFEKPSLDAMKLHGAKMGLPDAECERCFNHYESNGWRVGRNPMKRWESAMRNWKQNYDEQRFKTSGSNPAGHSRPLTGAEQRLVGIPDVPKFDYSKL